VFSREKEVASTKAFTAQISVLAMMALSWGSRGPSQKADTIQLLHELEAILLGRLKHYKVMRPIKYIAKSIQGVRNAIYSEEVIISR